MLDDEAVLIGRARDGDRTAFEALVSPLIETAYRLAYAMLQNREAAEDAVQESAFKAWRKLANLRAGWSMKPWFLGIVANECRSTRRGRWWSVLKLEVPSIALTFPEDDVIRGADLRKALRKLPVERLEVLLLHYYLDLTLEETAAVARVPVGTVKSRINRALQQLRPHIDPALEVFG